MSEEELASNTAGDEVDGIRQLMEICQTGTFDEVVDVVGRLDDPSRAILDVVPRRGNLLLHALLNTADPDAKIVRWLVDQYGYTLSDLCPHLKRKHFAMPGFIAKLISGFHATFADLAEEPNNDWSILTHVSNTSDLTALMTIEHAFPQALQRWYAESGMLDLSNLAAAAPWRQLVEFMNVSGLGPQVAVAWKIVAGWCQHTEVGALQRGVSELRLSPAQVCEGLDHHALLAACRRAPILHWLVMDYRLTARRIREREAAPGEILAEACGQGLEAVTLLVSYAGLEARDVLARNACAYQVACSADKLEVVQYLEAQFSLTDYDYRSAVEACMTRSAFKTLRWLADNRRGVQGIISEVNPLLLRRVFASHLAMAQWIDSISLTPFNLGQWLYHGRVFRFDQSAAEPDDDYQIFAKAAFENAQWLVNRYPISPQDAHKVAVLLLCAALTRKEITFAKWVMVRFSLPLHVFHEPSIMTAMEKAAGGRFVTDLRIGDKKGSAEFAAFYKWVQATSPL